MTIVLDSWAVLRFPKNTEPAASVVDELLSSTPPLMSWINLGEEAAIDTVRDLR